MYDWSLAGSVAAGEQEPPAVLDDASVVAGRQPLRPGAAGKRDQLGKAEAPVAADARVRRLPRGVAAHERLDHGAPELLAQIERHVRQAEPVAGRAGREHGLGRAAGALGVRAARIEPEPESDADRLRARRVAE